MITKKFEHITYEIHLKISAQGIIDKTDIIGSLYKQLKGVLKHKIDFEELVKLGKIGIINCSIKKIKSNSQAMCIIPTNLTKKEVCLLAAKCEKITKIGHTQGNIEVIEIKHSLEDIESEIENRAKELEEKFFKEDSNSKQKSKELNIIELCENVYSTPNCKRYKTIFLVEGRSDVKTLAYFGINNVISINGSYLDILKLKKEKWFNSKTFITFFDGDNSAKKLLAQLQEEINISKSYFAPKGLEVSQLKEDQIKSILEISKDLNENIKENNTQKDHFSKQEFFILENYLEAIKQTNRMVGFDSSFGIIFDEPISKLKEVNFQSIKYLLYDGMCENILIRKLKDIFLIVLIAKSFSEKPQNVHCISFEEFENAIEK